MAQMFTLPHARPLTSAGRIMAASKLYFYVVGTSTLTTIYSDADCAVPTANPAIADANGEFDAIYFTTDVDVVLKTSANVLVYGPETLPGGSITRTAAEIAAGVTPTDKRYPEGDVRRYGAVDNATSSTTGFQTAALLSGTVPIYIPAGTWNISSVTFTDGALVRTAGFGTIISQIAGYDGSPNAQARIVNLAGSNITFALEGVKITGQIATDSGEQNHAVFVYKAATSIDNITIGDVYGQDLRGDVLYIGAPSGFTTTNIRYGRITGNNVLRNVVSIVGGSYITGEAAIADGAVGLCVYDVEPDNDPSTDIHIDFIKGRFVQIAPPNAADYCDRITIGTMDLDPSYAANSTPAYASHISTYGLSTRNTRMVQIDNARIKNFTHYAWFQTFNVGELADQRIHFRHLDVSGCGASESTYNSPCVGTSMTFIRVDSGVFSLQAPTTDYCFYGNPANTTRMEIRNFTADGCVARFADFSVFDGLSINTANAAIALRDLTNSTVSNSNITIPTLVYNATNVSFERVDATCSTAYLVGTVPDVSFENCSGGLEGVSSPAQITASQNNYAVGQMVTDLRLNTSASWNITGITNGRKGRVMRVFNVGSFDVVLVNASGSSSAGNQFALGADLTINAGEGATLWYDTTSTGVWRCASRV